jgi:hypothetical protein
MAERHLRLAVNPETGESVPLSDDDCPLCKERDRELARQRTIIANLRRDKDAEARAHELWPKAVALFAEWKLATRKERSRWSADRFWLCQPYLASDGFVIARWAVWGVAYEPMRRQLPSGLWETYQDFELCFKSRGNFERYAKRGYANPEARAQFSLREQGLGEDGKDIDPNLYFKEK